MFCLEKTAPDTLNSIHIVGEPLIGDSIHDYRFGLAFDCQDQRPTRFFHTPDEDSAAALECREG